MKNYKVYGACALVLSTLLLPVFARNGNPRPFKARYERTVVLDLTDGSWTSRIAGEATHLGRFTAEGAGTFDPQTTVVFGEETYTAANGDQLIVEVEAVGDDPAVTTFIEGTGRFVGVSGSYSCTALAEPVEIWDWDNWTCTVTYTSFGAGTITY